MVFNIKIYLQDVGCGGIDWIEVAHDRDSWWALGKRWLNAGQDKRLGISLLS